MIDERASGGRVTARVLAIVTLPVLTLLACSSPQAGHSVQRKDQQGIAGDVQSPASSRRCGSDAECGDGFCDRGVCAVPNETYGQPCQPAPRTEEGLRDSKLPGCGAYVCSEGRCRSCSSNAECKRELGSPKCFAGLAHPGHRCGDPP